VKAKKWVFIVSLSLVKKLVLCLTEKFGLTKYSGKFENADSGGT